MRVVKDVVAIGCILSGVSVTLSYSVRKTGGKSNQRRKKGGLCQPQFLTHPVGNFLEAKPCQRVFQVSTRKADRDTLLFHLLAKLFDLGVVPVKKCVGIRVPAKKSDHATDAAKA